MKKYLISFLIIINPVFSQEIKVINDLSLWTGLSMKKNILKDFDLTINGQIRSFQNASKIDDILLNTDLKYFINKKFSIGGAMRYTYDLKRRNQAEHNFRHSLYISFKKKIKPKITINYRLKHQKEFINFYRRFLFWGTEKEYKTSIRNKIKFIYKLNTKNRIYSSVELFKVFKVYRNPYFDKIRFLIGNSIHAGLGDINLAIGLDKQINNNYPYSFVFLKTTYNMKK